MLQTDFDKLPFELPIEFSCNGKVVSTQGVGVCQQPEGTDSWVKFKLPPAQGQFRVTNCNNNLLPVTDFNYLTKKGGFLWLFDKQILSDDIYTLSLGKLNPSLNSCPTVISMAGKNTGIQKAILYYYITSATNPPYDQEVSFECVNMTKKTENGMGKCYRYAGMPFYMHVDVDPTDFGIIYATSPACGYSEKKNYDVGTTKVDLTMPFTLEGYCPVEIVHSRRVGGNYIDKRAAIKIISIDPTIYGIDKAHFFRVGKKIKMWRPLFAETVQLNFYNKNGTDYLLDRSEIVSDNNYAVDKNFDKFCAHSYSNERRGAYSEVCYLSSDYATIPEIKNISEGDLQ